MRASRPSHHLDLPLGRRGHRRRRGRRSAAGRAEPARGGAGARGRRRGRRPAPPARRAAESPSNAPATKPTARPAPSTPSNPKTVWWHELWKRGGRPNSPRSARPNRPCRPHAKRCRRYRTGPNSNGWPPTCPRCGRRRPPATRIENGCCAPSSPTSPASGDGPGQGADRDPLAHRRHRRHHRRPRYPPRHRQTQPITGRGDGDPLGPTTPTAELADQLNAAGLTTGTGAVRRQGRAVDPPRLPRPRPRTPTPTARSASPRPPHGSAPARASSTTGSRPANSTLDAAPAADSASPGTTASRPNAASA